MLYEPLIELLTRNQATINSYLIEKYNRQGFFDYLSPENLFELNNKLFSKLKTYLQFSNPRDWCDSVSQVSLDWYKRGAILEHCIWYFKEVFGEMERLIEQEFKQPQFDVLREKSIIRLRGLFTMTQMTLTIASVKKQTSQPV